MLADIINIWDIFYYGAQGLLAVFIPVLKFFFTPPMLPLTLLGIAINVVKAKLS